MWHRLRQTEWIETREPHFIYFSATSISSALCSGALLSTEVEQLILLPPVYDAMQSADLVLQ